MAIALRDVPPPAGRHHVAGREDLQIGQPLTADVSLRHSCDHVLARPVPALLDARHEIGLLLVQNCALLLSHRLLVRRNRLKKKIRTAVAPVPHHHFVGIRQTEQIQHHLGRNARCEIEIGIEPGALFELIKKFVDPTLNHRPQALDGARRHCPDKQRLEAVMIGVVAVKQPPIVMIDDVAETLRIGVWQIGIDCLNSIDAEVRSILQLENVLVAREIPGLRLFRPMYRLVLAHRFIVGIRILHRGGAEQPVAVRIGDGPAQTRPQARRPTSTNRSILRV